MVVAAHRVLLVDDDELTLQMLEASLAEGFRPSLASSGEQALQRCRREVFDLVVLDVEMPGMDGYQTCRALRALPGGEGLPIIFHSARTSIEERLRGYEAGGDDYLAKPFDAEELVAKIRLALRKRARERELAGQTHLLQEFRRRLAACASYEALAAELFTVLRIQGLTGCLRVRGRHDTVSLNAHASCTALELSLLDHLQGQREGPALRKLGPNTCLLHDKLILVLRERDSGAADGAERARLARAIDKAALLFEAVLSRLAVIDGDGAAQDLSGLRQTLQLTHAALGELAGLHQAYRAKVEEAFDELQRELGACFVLLSLNEVQEDSLGAVLALHGEARQSLQERGQELQVLLERGLSRLARSA